MCRPLRAALPSPPHRRGGSPRTSGGPGPPEEDGGRVGAACHPAPAPAPPSLLPPPQGLLPRAAGTCAHAGQPHLRPVLPGASPRPGPGAGGQLEGCGPGPGAGGAWPASEGCCLPPELIGPQHVPEPLHGGMVSAWAHETSGHGIIRNRGMGGLHPIWENHLIKMTRKVPFPGVSPSHHVEGDRLGWSPAACAATFWFPEELQRVDSGGSPSPLKGY